MAPQHFLVVAFPGQGHINPARALAERLVRAMPGARVTLSAAVSAHRLMFPSLASPDEEVHDGGMSYVPYSDGYDRGFHLFAGNGDDARRYCEAFGRVGPDTLSAVLDRLAARGQPVTCVLYTMLMWWTAEVARKRGLPRALYWNQPATMLAVYWHYFHGYERIVTEHAAEPGFTVAMPGLPPMAIRDLPSFFTDLTDGRIVAAFGNIRRTFQQLELDVDISTGGRKPMVLVNTVEALEVGALASVPELDMFPIGPAVLSLFTDDTRSGTNTVVGDLFEHDEKGYMEWLDTKPARSVVYMSFGSLAATTKQQKEEMKRGLAASGRSYLQVVRKDNRDTDDDDDDDDDDQSMVVEWCDQVRVLSHPAVGCFVTHCRWNSTLESVACGVPVVAVPQWSDQDTNARLVVEWGIGVRGAIHADRFLDAEELTRCVDMVMGDTEEGAAIRSSSITWKAKVHEAIRDGGSSELNLMTFQKQFANDA
ncbi:cyanidin 3-O-rutinoside 5-O-glucosyltransferase-like [Lolium rigidum]|uniref:cyanidin 3-O-rutinoside 5-O-glucosyltransferase-like n=1 Tax=Lolium rigidum TaxID=89674 RepID=UPI001F5D3777|nr:cyanidin 3-O-rutinoside 5-O-glucosyltransferase-like [Lolium rigidum]